MKDLKLTAPKQGETLVVALDGSYDALSLGFSLENVFFERTDNDLILSFDSNGSAIVLKDFYTVFNSDNVPQIVSENGMLTEGQAFLARLGSDLVVARAENSIKESRSEDTETLEKFVASSSEFVQTARSEAGVETDPYSVKFTVQLVGSNALAFLEPTISQNTTIPSPLPPINPTIPQVSIELGLGASAFIMPSQLGGSLSRGLGADDLPVTGKLAISNLDLDDLKITVTIEGLGSYIIDKNNYDPKTGEFTIILSKNDLLNSSVDKNPSFSFSIESGDIVSSPSNPLYLVNKYTSPEKVGETYIANTVDGSTHPTTAGTDGADKFAIGKLFNSAALVGGNGNDVFAVDILDNSSIDAGADTDSITITYAKDSTISAGLGDDIVEIIVPGGTNDPNAGDFSGTIYADVEQAIGAVEFGNDKITIDTILGGSAVYSDYSFSALSSSFGGNDTIEITNVEGDDITIFAGVGNDQIIITDIAGDTISIDSGTGNDNIQIKNISGSNITINGGDGNDNIEAGNISANDVTIKAGLGNDDVEISSFSGTNLVIDGGEGSDTFVYSGSSRVELTLNDYGNISGITNATITNFEDITSGSGNDVLVGNDFANELRSGGGADNVKGGGGNDTIRAAAGNDFINGGDGDDIIFGGTGNDNITGGAGADTYKWSASDVLVSANDTIAVDSLDALDLSEFKALGFEITVTASTGNVRLDLTLDSADYGSISHSIILNGIGNASDYEDQYNNENNAFINI